MSMKSHGWLAMSATFAGLVESDPFSCNLTVARSVTTSSPFSWRRVVRRAFSSWSTVPMTWPLVALGKRLHRLTLGLGTPRRGFPEEAVLVEKEQGTWLRESTAPIGCVVVSIMYGHLSVCARLLAAYTSLHDEH